MTVPDRDRARWGLEFRDVVFRSALCPEHKMLLLAIMSLMSPASCSSYPNLDTLQRRSSLSRTKVVQHLADLASHDWKSARLASWAVLAGSPTGTCYPGVSWSRTSRRTANDVEAGW